MLSNPSDVQSARLQMLGFYHVSSMKIDPLILPLTGTLYSVQNKGAGNGGIRTPYA